MDKKTIELFDAYSVEVNEQLLDDFNFIQDLAEAQRKNDLPEFVSLIFALVGGEKVYNDIRQHIEEEKGYFSQAELIKIVAKIGEVLPKAGNRAQRRSRWTLK